MIDNKEPLTKRPYRIFYPSPNMAEEIMLLHLYNTYDIQNVKKYVFSHKIQIRISRICTGRGECYGFLKLLINYTSVLQVLNTLILNSYFYLKNNN